MAYTIGVASNYKDLLSTLATFAAANGWTILTQSETELYMRGSGTDGLDKIYCGVLAFEDSVAGYYNWQLFGSVFYKSNNDITNQPLNSTATYPTYLYLWNSQIDYWMFATSRRIILVAKVATTYQHMYLGFLDPCGTAAQYPYPLLVGGSGHNTAYAYSATLQSAYWNSVSQISGRLFLPGGSWGKLWNSSYENSTGVIYRPDLFVRDMYFGDKGGMLTAPDESYLLSPIFILDRYRGGNYGQIDGVFRVTGYNNNSENIITVDGVNYIVFQDTYRTSYSDYCAIRMD